jgi:hypothetical protein
MTTNKYHLAAHRAAKTAAQAFLGSIVAAWLAGGDQSVSGLIDTIGSGADMAGGTAILAALAALGWNSVRLSGGDVEASKTPNP